MAPKSTFQIPILVVDDSASARTAISTPLQHAGYTVRSASSGAEALEILEHTAVALVITDQVMEGMDGSELCRRIRADVRCCALPVISLTSLSDKEAIRKIYAAGVSDYVRKPFIPEELLARVQVQLERSSLLHDLEQRVLERTAELAQANQALRAEIVERENAMKALEVARGQAERASQVKSRFLSNMSHELRTPLNGILGFARLALETKPEGELLSHLKLIQSSSEAMFQVINDILEFSRIEAGGAELHERNFEIAQFVASLEKFFVSECATQKKSVTFDISPTLPLIVKGDELRLKQIFINLLGNAFKFTPLGGTIMTTLRGEPGGGDSFTLHCTISDSGIGISKEVVQTIFEPFTQADSSDTRRYGGTGLGLATTAQLIKLMGGEISVESQEGVGSSFHFTVTLGAATQPLHAGTAPEVASEPPSPTGTVLVVEDNPINQKLLLAVLRKRGYNAIAAANGAEALSQMQSNPVSIVLMDCQMPVLDGYEATRRIRELAEHAKRDVPIIAVTASALDGDAERCFQAGMNALITKPISPSLLFQTIHRLTDPSTAVDAEDQPSST